MTVSTCGTPASTQREWTAAALCTLGGCKVSTPPASKFSPVVERYLDKSEQVALALLSMAPLR